MIYGFQIEEILEKNIEVVPYEGSSVNRVGIIEDILQLIEDDKQREGKDTA